MLRLGGFRRVVIILAAGLVAGIVHLYLPLLVNQAVKTGVFAAILVLLLWLGEWALISRPRARNKLLHGKTQLESPTDRTPEPPTVQAPKSKQNED